MPPSNSNRFNAAIANRRVLLPHFLAKKNMNSFNGKVVWITGASSGIGKEMARQLAQEGVRLVLSARRRELLQQIADELGLDSNRVLVLPLDMTEPERFGACVAAVQAHFGRIDVMVHNAGISQRGLFTEISAVDAQRLMDINFTNVVTLTREVLPVMLAQQSGAFLVTSSVSGKLGTPFRTMYCASKHALQGFFDGLRGEVWRQGIQVTVACPGYIHTDISLNAIGPDGKPYGKMDVNQAKGIPVEVCVRKMLKALRNGQHEIMIAGFMESLGAYLKRFAPSLLWMFVKNYNIQSTKS
jgi:dehydrogenase/reductase SDR family member 7